MGDEKTNKINPQKDLYLVKEMCDKAANDFCTEMKRIIGGIVK